MIIPEQKQNIFLIIAYNLIPLFFVFLGRGFAFVLLFYWLETFVIGIFNVLKIIVAKGGGPASFPLKFFVVPFFILHFGTFLMAHFIFIIFLAHQSGDLNFSSPAPFIVEMVVGFLGLCIYYSILFVRDYIVKGEYKSTSPFKLIFRPYWRVIVMQVSIIFGAFLFILLGSPFFLLLILVFLKTAGDVFSFYRKDKGLWLSLLRQ